jgi:hypothetical protein
MSEGGQLDRGSPSKSGGRRVFVLVVIIISATVTGGLVTQEQRGFRTYAECAQAGQARLQIERSLNRGADVRWQCLPE